MVTTPLTGTLLDVPLRVIPAAASPALSWLSPATGLTDRPLSRLLTVRVSLPVATFPALSATDTLICVVPLARSARSAAGTLTLQLPLG
ncbi:hypothetical protein D3C80_1922510 [compost metagenome]